MSYYDTCRGTVILPDGRPVHAVLRGHVLPAPDYWADGKEPLDMEWADGTPLEADDYNAEMVVGGKPYYLHEWVTEQLEQHGKWELADYDPYD